MPLPTIPELPEDTPSHVVFLHSEFRQEAQDNYLIDAANALHRFGHKVTICTSFFDNENPYRLSSAPEEMCMHFSGGWLPNSICNTFKGTLSKIKASWMAWRLVLCPPKHKPDVIILDVDSVALFILFWFSQYKTIYVYNLLQELIPDSTAAKTVSYANEIIVQSKCLRDGFKKSFPKIAIEPYVLHLCIDKRFWTTPTTDIKSLIPNLPPEYILYVACGDYLERSNFKLVLDAFHQMVSCMQSSLKNKFHLVIAGHCSETSFEQNLHYKNLINNNKETLHASQITFLKQASMVHVKTLFECCAAVIHPSSDYAHSETILAAMSCGQLIVAANTGFASEILTDGLTGILLELDFYKFSAAMFKAATSPVLKMFIGGRAQEAFNLYSFERFSHNLNDLVMKCVGAE